MKYVLFTYSGQYRAGQVVSSDNIQLHTFPPGASGSVQPVAPPSYDDVIASPDTYVPANNKEETEVLIGSLKMKKKYESLQLAIEKWQ